MPEEVNNNVDNTAFIAAPSLGEYVLYVRDNKPDELGNVPLHIAKLAYDGDKRILEKIEQKEADKTTDTIEWAGLKSILKNVFADVPTDIIFSYINKVLYEGNIEMQAKIGVKPEDIGKLKAAYEKAISELVVANEIPAINEVPAAPVVEAPVAEVPAVEVPVQPEPVISINVEPVVETPVVQSEVQMPQVASEPKSTSQLVVDLLDGLIQYIKTMGDVLNEHVANNEQKVIVLEEELNKMKAFVDTQKTQLTEIRDELNTAAVSMEPAMPAPANVELPSLVVEPSPQVLTKDIAA